ncbi:unnamed protein product [Strongylus vulgaris]|uniref:RRP12 HEAT domain-containing protein n=1 Tax=Strongylus vulgaris TaxID=40348 RepID=A0A3P7J9W4_STRVU|nr:unnamed protein product [Strongylus vulgaris]
MDRKEEIIEPLGSCYSLLPATFELIVKFFDTGDEQLAQITYQTVGCAVRHVGAPAVLAVIPLDIDPNAAVLSTEFTRSWLIPVLRVNLHNAPLAYFASHILPIAVKIYRLGTLDPVPQRLYTTLQMQLWELLPAFCDSPSDLEESFPHLAPVLGAAMNERDDLKLTILSALRRIVRFALQPDAPERVEVYFLSF